MTSAFGVASCPCGSGRPYAECCGALHRGERAAATAEELMRSRYSAFARGDEGYLIRTWHPSTRPESLSLDPRHRWTGLTLTATTGGGPDEDTGTVPTALPRSASTAHPTRCASTPGSRGAAAAGPTSTATSAELRAPGCG